MSWVIKASPEPIRVIRTEEDLPETRKMFCIVDDGLWLYGIWPAEDAPPQRRWAEVTGESEGYFYAKYGMLPNDVADRLELYHRVGDAPGIEDGYEAGKVWREHATNIVTMDEWENYAEEEDE